MKYAIVLPSRITGTSKISGGNAMTLSIDYLNKCAACGTNARLFCASGMMRRHIAIHLSVHPSVIVKGFI